MKPDCSTATIEVQSHKALAVWLFCVAGFVFAMIVIGAITRLTESGLSMVEWRPLIGALPPMNEAEWLRVFERYQESPEYLKKNFWMGLEDFKSIFFWEWFHRLWGRLIGLVYGVPYIYFLIRGRIPAGYHWPLFGLLLLGAAQGAMGWYMVKSGLVDVPAVSHYRLASHLSLAFLILALLTWFGLRLWHSAVRSHGRLYTYGCAAFGCLALTIFWGAYVAGLDAGLVYNEYPMMGGSFMPTEMWQYQPFWINFFENIPAVQFVHRWLAAFTVVVIFMYSVFSMRAGYTQLRFVLLGLAVLLQFSLGVATLLSGVYLPLAVLHQAVAACLVVLLTSCLQSMRP